MSAWTQVGPGANLDGIGASHRQQRARGSGACGHYPPGASDLVERGGDGVDVADSASPLNEESPGRGIQIASAEVCGGVFTANADAAIALQHEPGIDPCNQLDAGLDISTASY